MRYPLSVWQYHTVITATRHRWTRLTPARQTHLSILIIIIAGMPLTGAYSRFHQCLHRSRYLSWSDRTVNAKKSWMAGYIPRWFTCLPTVPHPSTDWTGLQLTSLMRPTTLPTPNRQLYVPTRAIQDYSVVLVCTNCTERLFIARVRIQSGKTEYVLLQLFYFSLSRSSR